MTKEHIFLTTFYKAFIPRNFRCCLVDSGRRRLKTGVLCLRGVKGGFFIFSLQFRVQVNCFLIVPTMPAEVRVFPWGVGGGGEISLHNRSSPEEFGRILGGPGT